MPVVPSPPRPTTPTRVPFVAFHCLRGAYMVMPAHMIGPAYLRKKERKKGSHTCVLVCSTAHTATQYTPHCTLHIHCTHSTQR